MRLKNESRNKEVLTRLGRKLELLALIEEADITKFVLVT